MLSPTLRWLLILIALVAGGILEWLRNPVGWLFWVVAVLWVYGHFRYGPIWTAFRSLKAGDVERARRLVGTIETPSFLSAPQRTYYHVIRGELAVQDGRFQEAVEEFERALGGPFPNSHSEAAGWMILAQARFRDGDSASAKEALRRATEIPHRDELNPQLEAVARMIEQNS